MSSSLSGIKISVIGGDDREIVLMGELVKMGATVTAVGFPRERVRHGVGLARSVSEALRGAEVAVLPMPGISQDGVIRAVYSEEKLELTRDALAGMARPGLVIIGSAHQFLRDWTDELGLSLKAIAEMDEVAILNSIPTAEGAIQIAMEEIPVTIHGSRCGVVGMGRVGQTLARKLKALDAEVWVASRDPGERARAREMNCRSLTMEELTEMLQWADLVFNTVPSQVLTRDVLRMANPQVLIIDLAAQPGGTDFEAANAYGIRAILAPGLPGKVAPYSAGRILADVVPRIIVEELPALEGASVFA